MKEVGKKKRLQPFEALYGIVRDRSLEGFPMCVPLGYREFIEAIGSGHAHCHYCAKELSFTEFCVSANGGASNLDRKNNLLGYISGNVVPCCWRCNQGKGNRYNYQQWHALTAHLRGDAVANPEDIAFCFPAVRPMLYASKCTYRKEEFQSLYNLLAKTSLKRGMGTIAITFEEFRSVIKNGEASCHYCTTPLAFPRWALGRNGCRYNLDRKDNALAYTADNVVPCCWTCNAAKSARFTYGEWYGMTAYLRERASAEKLSAA